MFNKNGFSLAEILIVLTIIGIVAAIVTPSLSSNYKKHAYSNAIKKFNVDLNEALDMYMTEQGKRRFDQTDFIKDTNYGVANFMKSNFNVVKTCSNAGDCFYDGYYRAIKDPDNKIKISDVCTTVSYDHYGTPIETGARIFALPNSAAICFNIYKSVNTTIDVYVDINGASGPNIGGRDLFMYNVHQITGNIQDTAPGACGYLANGLGCIAELENNDWKMNY